jgi:hypothetical protein
MRTVRQPSPTFAPAAIVGRSTQRTQPAADASADALPDLGAFVRAGSLLLSLLFLAKAYGVAHYSLTTMGELLSTAPVTALLGTVASYMYVILPVIAVGGTWWMWETRTTAAPTRPAAIALVVVAAALSPWPYLAVLSSGGLGLFALTQFARRRLAHVPRVRVAASHASLYFSVLAAVVFFIATIDKPWVPAEVLVTDSEVLVNARNNEREKSPAVYVLKEDGDMLVVMTARHRQVVRIPTSIIKERIICHDRNQLAGERPLIDTLRGRRYKSPNISCGRLRREVLRGTFAP